MDARPRNRPRRASFRQGDQALPGAGAPLRNRADERGPECWCRRRSTAPVFANRLAEFRPPVFTEWRLQAGPPHARVAQLERRLVLFGAEFSRIPSSMTARNVTPCRAAYRLALAARSSVNSMVVFIAATFRVQGIWATIFSGCHNVKEMSGTVPSCPRPLGGHPHRAGVWPHNPCRRRRWLPTIARAAGVRPERSAEPSFRMRERWRTGREWERDPEQWPKPIFQRRSDAVFPCRGTSTYPSPWRT